MTDDPNVEPKPEPELEPNVLSESAAATEGGEEAEDLDASQLEAAAEGAEDEVGDAGDEEAEALEAARDETAVLAPGDLQAVPIGAPGGVIEPEERGPRPRGPKAPSRTAFAIDPALRIQDRASAAFVIVTVAVFVLILANAMLLGHGGALTPIPTASPIPQLTEAPSESPSASGSPAPSTSTAPTIGPSSSPAGSPASFAPTTTPSPAAS